MRLMTHLIFRLIVVLIIPSVTVSGCSTEEEIKTAKIKNFLKNTTNADWGNQIPLDNLLLAAKVCQSGGDFKTECIAVSDQINDISVSYKSCAQNPSSALCQAVISLVKSHQILKILPQSSAILLPHDPFYMQMPTHMLDAMSWSYQYRREAIGWWLTARAETIVWWLTTWADTIAIILVSAVLLAILIFRLWKRWKNKKTIKMHEARAAHQRQVQQQQQRERALRIEAAQRQQEAELEKNQDYFTNDTSQLVNTSPTISDTQSEQQSIRQAELNAKKEKANSEAKLKSERQEVKAILAIAFPRKNLSKPGKPVVDGVFE